MLDEAIIKAINAGTGAGFPEGAGAVLLIELDGPRAEVETQAQRAAEICRQRGAISVSVARDDAERALLWKGRKEAAGAVGRLTAAYLLQDAVVPRSKLPQIMRELVSIAERHRLLIANVFHAGDGNLHPLICYDDRDPDQLARAKQANEELLRACIALGGSVTGEHGIGARQVPEPDAAVRRGRSELHVSAAGRLRSRPPDESRQAAAHAPGVRRGIPAGAAGVARRDVGVSVTTRALG